MNFEKFKSNFQKVSVEEYTNKVGDSPLVTVCIQTYQQVEYIKYCLDGILMQKTNFLFEILLGEDASTDGTREICIDYAEKFPDKIRLFLHHRENNIKKNGTPTGKFNFLYNLYSARGKYIAICEGDDYWTDPYKLQKQVDFLENHKNYSGCFCNTQYANSKNVIVGKCERVPEGVTDIKFEDLTQRMFMHTPSVVLRRNVVTEKSLRIILSSPVGDVPLFLIASLYGPLKYIDELMVIYRQSVGISMRDWQANTGYDYKIIVLDSIAKEYNLTYNQRYSIRIGKAWYNLKLSKLYGLGGEIKMFKYYFIFIKNRIYSIFFKGIRFETVDLYDYLRPIWYYFAAKFNIRSNTKINN